MRVLIADDDPGFRTFMRGALKYEADLSVVGEAMDGLEAVRKANELKPALVFMDIDLPRTDGLEATRQIKGSLPGTVVIVFSPLDCMVHRDAAARSGANAFLVKTTPISKILSTTRQLLQGEAVGSRPLVREPV
jgi:DNA-binding NarL/FixJ family response regulator